MKGGVGGELNGGDGNGKICRLVGSFERKAGGGWLVQVKTVRQTAWAEAVSVRDVLMA